VAIGRLADRRQSRRRQQRSGSLAESGRLTLFFNTAHSSTLPRAGRQIVIFLLEQPKKKEREKKIFFPQTRFSFLLVYRPARESFRHAHYSLRFLFIPRDLYLPRLGGPARTGGGEKKERKREKKKRKNEKQRGRGEEDRFGVRISEWSPKFAASEKV